MSTRCISWSKGGRCVRLTTLPPSYAVVMKSVNSNLLEPSEPLQACKGTTLPLLLWLVVNELLSTELTLARRRFWKERLHRIPWKPDRRVSRWYWIKDRGTDRQTQIGVVVTYAFSFPSDRTPNKCQLLQMWLLANSAGLWTEPETSIWWALN